MSYQVLARKYRPQTFDDVVAQEHVTRTIRNALKHDRVGSGYLFCGPRGTGKTTTARILAKSLNCTGGPTDTPCGACSNCIEIARGVSLDVLEIDAASNTGVDDIRSLREHVRYMPSSGAKRIYIIDEVHRLSGAAFDALLKTLEEPPEHVIFIFATTEVLKVPDTILSRTQRFDFRAVTTEKLVGNLQHIAKAEKLHVEPAALDLIARKADGSVRDSLSLLDQVVAYAEGEIDKATVIEALGIIDRQIVFDLIEAIALEDRRKALLLVRNVVEGGAEVKEFVNELLDHLRILLILNADKDASDLAGVARDELERYRGQGANFSTGDLLRLMKMTTDLHADLKSGLDERLVLEIMAVKMAELEATVRFEDIVAYLRQQPQSSTANGLDLFGGSQKKKNGEPQTMQAARHVTEKTSSVEQTDTGQASYSRRVNTAIVENDWSRFLSLLRQRKPMLASQLGMAKLGGVENNRIRLVFPASSATSRQILEKPANLRFITSLVSEQYKAPLQFQIEVSSDEKADVPAAEISRAGPDTQALIDRSPRLKALLEKVEGEIIGIQKVNNGKNNE
ncbi:MAG: DNA polymerase III subunit gamma/tau [Candidatus Zixiibacteriota bacterium]